MPELPEVETVRRGIIPLLEGRALSRVIQRRDTLRIPLPENFADRLTGRRIDKITRRAKYLLFALDQGETLICHLGMSGKMTLVARAGRETPDIFAKHDHVILENDQGDLVIFNDPRRFGLMTLCATEELDQHRLFCQMGPEPLGNAFHSDYLFDKMRGKRSPVKTVLLDQRVVVGLGNIYVCEALYLAGISPLRPATDLDRETVERLVPIIRQVLARAIEAGGSTLKDYARVDGELGYFQHEFKVYGREGEACHTTGCDHSIVRIPQSGRSTFYCPACQD
ncbi:bifunctional DNA-formamidopyrimidine glycosylase/DNA-(apurinic or apyrimidinic site) lyase [Paremcibacter congregatus]|uniref:Formamidopyrimidine-DNA glycosylase n=1 Tax=Paremcibacter congregatus TaxID=2043170 RepID=A0A2G4YPB1_9PROT|nr:bifunctional DNA-formamidopyrimidine glycosylase/DNA-(apurinic or apyrimidinic site) lyase [Paremcibacter congregatus]PHZ84172.1 DNA-formamidopyrimidine glycosylase [Paremcibacter congregatus]QDE29096.1 bifunctional DNA-formamidopyrimidine glycosylase/DNA-(apurinic or apyrimidinic site) lyase [Paremcibacter congregatus]